jgi:hypothetical protein|tara:strand:+ start:1397 stop:1765 length:369 start_codon:yes stop_codon:yes gene_type:complete
MILKNTFKLGLYALIFTFIFCKKQESTNNTKTENTMKTNQTNRVGGFKSIEVSDEIIALSTFVLSEKNITSSVKEITNCATQVVSGRNYRFDILLENNESWSTQVYIDLQKNKTITRFELLK